MKNLLKYEFYKLKYSYSLIYASLICILLSCVTNFVIAGAPQSPIVYSMAFEFFIPQLLVFSIPSLFIANGIRNGKIKTELLCGAKRPLIFFAKTIVYYFALFVIFNFYILLLTFMNIKDIGVQLINGENSFLFFLRSASIGFAYCFMLSTILLFISVLFTSPTLTSIGSFILFLIEFLAKSTIDWRIADRIVPSLMIEQLILKNADINTIIGFSLMIFLVTVIFYILSIIIYCKKSYK